MITVQSPIPTHKGASVMLITVLLILAATRPTAADTILMGASFSIPPYVIRETDQGIEPDILRESFERRGHKVKMEYLPLARTFGHLKSGLIDGAINVTEGLLEDVFYSDVVILFQNCAISLAKRNYPPFDSVAFLADKHVIAFQRASTILGPAFGEMASNNSRYEETAVQKTQLFRLFLERDADFIIIEQRIFAYYRKEARRRLGAVADQPVRLDCIFPSTAYRFAFRSRTLRDDFNAGLQAIRAEGVYDRIMERYAQVGAQP